MPHSITTTYHTCIQVEVVLVGDTTFRWWHCSFPLSKKYAYHGTKQWLESIQRYDNRVAMGIQATVSDFWPTWDGLPSLSLAIHSEPLWYDRWLV